MKQKRRTATLKALFFIPILMVIMIVLSFTSQERITFKLDSDGFPVIHLPHPNGKAIFISAPSGETGSVGVELDGKLFWAKGEPSGTTTTEKSHSWAWEVNQNDSLILRLEETGNGQYRISLTTASGSQTRSFIYLSAAPDEYFTGVFERVVDGHQNKSWEKGISTGLGLRGQRMDVRLKPTVSAYAPFFVSSADYSFFVRGTWPGLFDFCSQYPDHVEAAFEGPVMEIDLSTASDPMKLVQRHALAAGPSVVPPEWAFGPWRWRDEHTNRPEYFDGTTVTAPYNSDLVEDVLMMKFYDVPCSALWIDRPWGPGTRGFDDYEFDSDRFPHSVEMIRWLNRNGLELMMWIAPFVMGKQADYAEARGYDLESKERGGSRQVLMDFTNPEAVEWWGEYGPGKLARMGIRGFKLDRADGEKLVDSLHLFTFKGTSYRENFNDYPHQYVRATYQAVQPVLGENFILFPRAQYNGSARYGGMWAGDTNGKPEGLRSAVIGLQRCAIMGYPIWGSDIGGYWGEFNRETCIRWLGFGCFSPLMELGPVLNHGFWDMGTEHKPDQELIAAWRLYASIRLKLASYIRSLAEEARETGTPIVRPLFLQYPDQPEAWNDWQTYLMGPDLLVHVIWEKGKTSGKLYLPAGETWINAWNPSEEYMGGQYLEVEAPLYQTPLFIRKNSDIRLGNLNDLYKESLSMAGETFDLSKLESLEVW